MGEELGEDVELGVLELPVCCSRMEYGGAEGRVGLMDGDRRRDGGGGFDECFLGEAGDRGEGMYTVPGGVICVLIPVSSLGEEIEGLVEVIDEGGSAAICRICLCFGGIRMDLG